MFLLPPVDLGDPRCTHLFWLPLAACRSPLGLGTRVWVSVRAILRVEPTQSGWMRVDYVRSKSRFGPRSPRYGLFLVWGCRRPMCTNSRAFGGLFGAVRGRNMELEGPRGTFGIGKSSCMCSHYFPSFRRFRARSRAVLGKKRLILALNCRF